MAHNRRPSRRAVKGQLRGLARHLTAAKTGNRNDQVATLALRLLLIEQEAHALRKSLADDIEPGSFITSRWPNQREREVKP